LDLHLEEDRGGVGGVRATSEMEVPRQKRRDKMQKDVDTHHQQLPSEKGRPRGAAYLHVNDDSIDEEDQSVGSAYLDINEEPIDEEDRSGGPAEIDMTASFEDVDVVENIWEAVDATREPKEDDGLRGTTATTTTTETSHTDKGLAWQDWETINQPQRVESTTEEDKLDLLLRKKGKWTYIDSFEYV